MSVLQIILIVLAALFVLFFVGGFVASRRRTDSPDYARHVAEADNALEQARAADRGWDRALLEQTAAAALSAERPDWHYDDLHLVLVDDRPGVVDDRAHLVAVDSSGTEVSLVLTREAGGAWLVEQISS